MFLGAGYLEGYNATDSTDLGVIPGASTTRRPAAALGDGEAVLFGGVQTNKTWIYDGKKWTQKADMLIARDGPACSIVQETNGKVNYMPDCTYRLLASSYMISRYILINSKTYLSLD